MRFDTRNKPFKVTWTEDKARRLQQLADVHGAPMGVFFTTSGALFVEQVTPKPPRTYDYLYTAQPR
jgi:hypothetical protein